MQTRLTFAKRQRVAAEASPGSPAPEQGQANGDSGEQAEVLRLTVAGCWLERRVRLPRAVRLDARLYAALWEARPPTLGTVRLYGRTLQTPRWQQSFLHNYYFSGELHVGRALYSSAPAVAFPQTASSSPSSLADPPGALSPASSAPATRGDSGGDAGEAEALEWLRGVMEWVHTDSGGRPYYQLLVNWYADGAHHIGPHSDDERQLEPGAPIYSFSYGAERRFIIHKRFANGKPGGGTEQELMLELRNNTLLTMCGAMQRHYKHSVPPQPRCTASRINVTLRLFRCCVVSHDATVAVTAPLLGGSAPLARLVARYAGCPSMRLFGALPT